jgi:hypothetical protein
LPDLVRSRPPVRLPWRYFWHWQRMRRARARLAKRRREQ